MEDIHEDVNDLSEKLQDSKLSASDSFQNPVYTDADCKDEKQEYNTIDLVNNEIFENQTRLALNQQTLVQYEQYAKEQHPKDSHLQKLLVEQLQEQYFCQYMYEMYPTQVYHQKIQMDLVRSLQKQESEAGDVGSPKALPLFPIVPANLWTKTNVKEFKNQIWTHQRECAIKIGSLASATIRVPTHIDGACIFWEFATDYYDLGFGLFFEWSLETSDKITVHISESSDDEYEDDNENANANDVEAASSPVEQGKTSGSKPGEEEEGELKRRMSIGSGDPPTDELIPVFRRDCHDAVYCGSHHYPGYGYYILKFDNSFSLWRSKWLYYRVYYSR